MGVGSRSPGATEKNDGCQSWDPEVRNFNPERMHMRMPSLRAQVAGCLAFATLPLAATTPSIGQDATKGSPPAGGATSRGATNPRVMTSAPDPKQTPATYPPCRIPKALHDKPFDRFVDVLLLGEAWDYHDAEWITDMGLQIAEGERVLMRPHKVLESAKLLEVAAHIAGDQKDKPTLDRLAKVAQVRRDERLSSAVEAARKVAAEAPADVHHRLGDSVEDLSPRALTMHQAAIRKIRALRLAGDREKLDSFDKHLDTVDTLHEGQQGHLDHEIAKARKNAVKDDSLGRTIEVLDKLAALTPCSKID